MFRIYQKNVKKMVKKLIVFMLAAVLVSCSQEDLKMIEENKRLKKEYDKERTFESYKVNYSYERSLDTIMVSGQYVIVAVYTSGRGISTVIVGKPTRLD